MTNLFGKYAELIKSGTTDIHEAALLLGKTESLEIKYAPFDYINAKAKLVIVGLTPGEYQANEALRKAQQSLLNGDNNETASQLAKEAASFSGPMRNNLIGLLNYIGINEIFNITDCGSLFSGDADLVHYTSALRYPVFKNGSNYSGSPKLLKTSLLKQCVDTYLQTEVSLLSNAIFIPLGQPAAEALLYLSGKGAVDRNKILDGLPHPSGANQERIAFFMERNGGRKPSIKTNVDKIISARSILNSRVNSLLTVS